MVGVGDGCLFLYYWGLTVARTGVGRIGIAEDEVGPDEGEVYGLAGA